MTTEAIRQQAKPVPGKAEQHATRAVFFVGGFGAASWAPLVPYLKLRLGIAEDVLGMLLLCIGIGSLLTMPITGAATARLGCKKVLCAVITVYAFLLLGLCTVESFPLAVVLLLLFGACMGCVDVVINIQAVIVEKAADKRIMSGLHALWSVGGFAGAALFSLWVGSIGLSPFASTVIAVCTMLVLLLLSAKYLLPYGGEGGGALIAIPRGIVVFIGLIAMISFLVEGAMMDWGGVFLTTVHGFDIAVAGIGFSVFSIAMLTFRLLGDSLVKHLGAKVVVIGGSLVSAVGFALVILGSFELMIYAGFFLIGTGCANIVPVFFSLLGKQDVMPISLAVPAVSTMGYFGILAGPASIGFIAHQTSLLASFAMLGTLVVIQAAVAAYVYKRVGE